MIKMFIKSTFMKIFVRIISTTKRFAERAKLVLIERAGRKSISVVEEYPGEIDEIKQCHL